MAKYKRVWNENQYRKYLAEGRGQGVLKNYKPWIQIQDFPSRGIVSRVKGRKTGRVHHLMSNLELEYFYLLDWSEKTQDIREQYPLEDLTTAISIAETAVKRAIIPVMLIIMRIKRPTIDAESKRNYRRCS